jgi:undecaprenyl diphosphate synthase
LSEQKVTLSPGRLPRHIAIIMDGNGRWAEHRDMERILGHREGSRSVRDVVTAAREAGIEALTLYAFSSQNWTRPGDEVAGLMQLLFDFLSSERTTILDNDIKLQSIGDTERLPDFVKDKLRNLEAESAHCASMVLTLALSYGGREELVAAARSIAADVAAGVLRPEDVDEAAIEARTFTHDLPPLDLVIRTSGELRLSNFLLWQVAYAEIVVTDVLWPDFRRIELYDAIVEYRGRERRFGMTGDQARACVDQTPT